MPVLFCSALASRGLLCAVPTHWVMILLFFVFRSEPDEALWISAAVVVLILGAGLAGFVVARKIQTTRSRMAIGPRAVCQWRPLVFVVGIASAIGGVFLMQSINSVMPQLSLALGLAMVVLESAATLGSRSGPALSDDDIPVPEEPVVMPRRFAPASFACVAVVLPLSWWLLGEA